MRAALGRSALVGRAAAGGMSPRAGRPPRCAHRPRWLGSGSSADRAPSSSAATVELTSMIHEAGKLLPHQAILENFVHHNPWENLQSMDFFEAHRHVHALESTLSPGERMAALARGDPRPRANEAVVELSAVFLDRGAAKWKAPDRDKGFLHFFASVEALGFAPWRRHARAQAARILAADADASLCAAQVVRENLEFFGALPEQRTAQIRAMLLDLKGWASVFQRMEQHPSEAPPGASVQLAEFAAVQSILMRASIDAQARRAGWDPSTPIGEFLDRAPAARAGGASLLNNAEVQNPSSLAAGDQNAQQREGLERQFEDMVLQAVQRNSGRLATSPAILPDRPLLQVFTCIDERECSFRRHLESSAGDSNVVVETFGVPGFFGFQICFQGQGKEHEIILAPEGAQPGHTLVESQQSKEFTERSQLMAKLEQWWERASFSPVGSLLLSALFPVTATRQVLMSFFPTTTHHLSKQLYDAVVPDSQTDLNSPFSSEEAAMLLAATFNNIGRRDGWAPIVMVLGHGSRSVNNPFDAAHNCGACGGREGGPNARLMARYANDRAVRELLLQNHGIAVGDDTWFVGGYHDTTSELVDLFDLDVVPASFGASLSEARRLVDKARGGNALERCEKFMLASNVKTPAEALTHVHTRSTDLGEARPELGHATNAAVILGRRELTKGTFLSRRAFLPSYDPHNDDDTGTNLEGVLAPALIVCSGISLEYLLCTVDGGAGTKAPMNVVGDFGVQQGTSGDLLIGLPTQMTEMHAALRALYLIDAPIERVEAVLDRRPELADIVRNGWVRLFVRDPATERVYRHATDGEYEAVDVAIDPHHELEKQQQPEHGSYHTGFVPFTHQYNHARQVTSSEQMHTGAAASGMLLSCGLPILAYGPGFEMAAAGASMHAQGPLIALGGTVLSLSALGFSRRYLHGEHMFGRFAMLQAGLLAGFNLVALAPDLDHVLAGWSLMGFCSAFLIGAYNERPTVRQNATYAFGAYQLSDAALLSAVAFGAYGAHTAPHDPAAAFLTASGLGVAALLKSSQFPLTNLFQRSMEGASPTSALGYAGISAHVGIVLLASTTELWCEHDAVRLGLAGAGMLTAINSGLVAQIRADRKGSLANATSATLGLLYVLLAAGYVDTALVLSGGHAAFRMTQVMRSPNILLDNHNAKSALGSEVAGPKPVSAALFRASWACSRVNSDLQLPQLPGAVVSMISPRGDHSAGDKTEPDSKLAQWAKTAACVGLAGAPFTPLAHLKEEALVELLQTHPAQAAAAMGLSVAWSTLLVHHALCNVLDPRRFREPSRVQRDAPGGLPKHRC